MKHVVRSCAFLVACAPLFWGVAPSSAEISMPGITALVSAPRHDVAFDSRNQVFLVVAEGPPIRGQFLDKDGAPIGPLFNIALETPPGSNTPYTSWATVTAGGTAEDPAFLVTYLQIIREANPVIVTKWGRLVRYLPNGQAAVSARSKIADSDTEWFAADRSRALWNGQQFIVGTRVKPPGALVPGVQLQHVDLSGVASAPQFLSDFSDFEAGPSLACASDGVCLAVGFASFGGRGGSWARLFDANTLAPLGGRFYLDDHSSFMDSQNVVYSASAGKFITAWYRRGTNPASWVDFRTVAKDGTMGPLDLSRSYGPGAGEVTLAYNPVSKTSLLISKFGGSADLMALELGDDGYPTSLNSALRVTPWDGKVLEYRPAVTVNTVTAEWMATFVLASRGNAARIRGTSGNGGEGNLTPPPDQRPSPSLPPVTQIDLNVPNGSWFFAEGVASSDGLLFDTKYVLVNEGDQEVSVRGYFSKDDGTTTEKTYLLGAQTRRTLSLKTEVGNGAYAAVMQSLTPGRQVYASREVVWGSGGYGSTSEVATPAASQTWYFAEGSRRFEFFQNFFSLFNPGATSAHVTLTFFKPDGSQPTATAVVGPQSRFTFWANVLASLANSDFSLRIDSDLPIVAERAMYWGNNFEGGHDSVGTPSGSNTWYFAEGAAAPGFETYYTILNPQPSPIAVDITYYLDSSLGNAPIVKSYTVPANARYTVQLNAALGNIGGCSTRISSRNGEMIVAERSIYWGRSQFGIDGTNAVGAKAAALKWHVPEGSFEAGVDGFLLMANPNSSDVSVNVVLYTENGERFTEAKNIPAGTRKTLYLRDDFTSNPTDRTALTGKRFAVKVESTSGGPIVVEYATYRGDSGMDYWRSGSGAFGLPE